MFQLTWSVSSVAAVAHIMGAIGFVLVAVT